MTSPYSFRIPTAFLAIKPTNDTILLQRENLFASLIFLTWFFNRDFLVDISRRQEIYHDSLRDYIFDQEKDPIRKKYFWHVLNSDTKWYIEVLLDASQKNIGVISKYKELETYVKFLKTELHDLVRYSKENLDDIAITI